MTWTIKDTKRGNEREADTRAEAEETKINLISLGASPEQIEVIPPNAKSDGGTETVEPDVVDNSEPATVQTETTPENTPEITQQDLQAIDELGESLGTDPLSILPGHMIDTIQGQPAVNKRGYAMIAERYGIGVSARVVQFPWDNDEGRCVAHARAETEDGREYSGWATASAEDGDMSDQLIELAETRALKRAVSWASGVGIVSYVELTGELE